MASVEEESSPATTPADPVTPPEQILMLDPINPQVAARMARNFERWKRFEPGRQAMMKAHLERVAAFKGISLEVREVVSKALA